MLGVPEDTAGDDWLTINPWQALADGAARDVGLLVGHTRDEHRLFSLIDGVPGQVRMPSLHLADAQIADGGQAYPEETSRLLWQNHTFAALPLLRRPR